MLTDNTFPHQNGDSLRKTAYFVPRPLGQDQRPVPQRPLVKKPDSGKYVLPDSLSKHKIESLDTLIDDHLLKVIESTDGRIAETLKQQDPEIKISLTQKPYTSRDQQSGQPTLGTSVVPPAEYFLSASPQLVTKALSLAALTRELVMDCFEIDNREIHLEGLADAWEYVYGLFYAFLKDQNDTEILSVEELMALEEFLNDPETLLKESPVLRVVLKFFDELREPDESYKAYLEEQDEKSDIPDIERTTAFGNALKKIIRDNEKEGNDQKNLLFKELRKHNPSLSITGFTLPGDQKVDFRELCCAYMKISHLRSRMALSEMSERYIEAKASYAIEKILESAPEIASSEELEHALSHIEQAISQSPDPVLRATRDFLVNKYAS